MEVSKLRQEQGQDNEDSAHPGLAVWRKGFQSDSSQSYQALGLRWRNTWTLGPHKSIWKPWRCSGESRVASSRGSRRTLVKSMSYGYHKNPKVWGGVKPTIHSTGMCPPQLLFFYRNWGSEPLWERNDVVPSRKSPSRCAFLRMGL